MDTQFLRPDPRDEYLTDERCHILELSNSPQDADASIARARVEPGETTALHQLSGTVERYVMLEGHGVAEVGGEEQSVEPGDIVIIPAEVSQRVRNTGDTDLVFLCVCTPRFKRDNYKDLET